ncbi:Guanylate cyclase 32E,Guanylate cyclase soluble subunit beta-2,Receptor-type guanylate cyclase gcy-19,Head-specific guanylate cyclase,Retinal guanylyl cyclase 2,Heat-stable enterotoxin receptor,Olfactory guanylyl cyclase GC-D,Atrial natriuretic peptide receptor 2,Receptor-type guanylate cyclase gcy-9,Receptor-type guanylate cyclase Gyc76C,Soluble guanylate cyclase 89Da,Receptor-type guanylate cyclase gcy-18,Receptor-type guanylate cyclase gcy-28,Receptor-type guanylate cyclase gcy-29,Receptor-type guanylat|uniref:Guanylate cyclase domain-containing protein n=1 Tax=Mytilus coruscus TaxID=42192 RepID=A0A6J8DCE9_MYTCO|nr:Guanylate cyclase 32E,Guanylate cyclase soluble subunit beta-2,Receptor-type guanylate cyclase gcy-19,Head-specific guanylate cyclase,Retinal guanylyl cyclase 2,Heat-stable enterotoxin receptor,Olfactory guanylyl cyclase GC-D,Atrial natriuretic peptide receptor 2,Receptor-type guanylate cyclase gcy-9,Receptor-type guanylate cyclase Gyc76C,Soluble guanylate cyclase 89Da,Receptor-type guanylate cyclase gcy-18,Receptor-type guanylate cyclase gcy-28,Receptor-type guanylate cyclase gcy-29,Receptor-ty
MSYRKSSISITETSKDTFDSNLLAPIDRFSVFSTNVSTKRGQNCQMLKIIALVIIPIIAMVIENAFKISKDEENLSQEKKIREKISFSVEIGLLVHFLQIERGTTALYISSGGNPLVLTDLQTNRLKTDSSLDSLRDWITLSSPSQFRSRDAYRIHLQNYRDNLDHLNTTINAVIKFYSNDNALIIGWVGSSVKESNSAIAWQSLTAYHMLLISKEEAGIERALGSTFYAREGSFPLEDLLWYTEKKTLGETYLLRSMQYSDTAKNLLHDYYTHTDLATELNIMRQQISANNETRASVIDGMVWFDNMTSFINILKSIQDELAQDIIVALDNHLNDDEMDVIRGKSIVVGAIIMFPVIVLLVYRLYRTLQSFANSLKNKTLDLEHERKRSEQLLYRMLPVAIAKRMMKKKTIVPEYFKSVTVYFSDIVGFTNICSKSSPMEVIYMLNALYSVMDERIEKFDVYKVETIGDGYMMVSGLPIRNKDRHALEIALMSLYILEIVSESEIPHLPDEKWQIRIGINTGSVVAGVVGTKMPRYCLFGDTVNVASRMESTSKSCMIQISSTTKCALEQHPGFLLQRRGEMIIKGKGLMVTYWLMGHQTIRNCSDCMDQDLFITDINNTEIHD